jgi:Fe(3+) dicitrate transport protein
VLLLEDGIPLSYAPYGDNASYYHPPIERFERIDILKGAEQIRFGPQTAGGLINYITPLPTKEPSGLVSVAGGNRDYLSAQAQLSRGPVLIDYIYKQSDGSRDNTHAQLNDFNVKGVFDLTANQALTLRANYYSENSTVTYSGLTDAEYENFGPEYNPFANDTFDAYRVGASATHELRFNSAVYMLTNLYGAYFNRDWWRQSSSTTDGQCGTAFTNARLAGLAVDVNSCNSTQGRLRSYWTYGIEPRLYASFRALGAENQLEVAVKAHFETQDRQQQDGNSPTARIGRITEDNEREVDAYSGFIQNRFIYGPFSVTPGVRYEYMNFTRTNHLASGGQGLSGSTSLSEWIPGVGLTYNPAATTTLYAGWHRGFSPPRVEDVINNTTLQSVDVEADDADEWEIGVRSAPRPGIQVEAAYFRNDFSNQTVVGNVAGGSLPLATGSALYQGLDLSGRIDLGPLLSTPHNVYMRLAYMWLPTAEITSVFRSVQTGQPIQGNTVGNRLPYAPENLLNFGIGYSHPIGFSGELEFVYTSKQYSDFANTTTPPPNGSGQVGIIEGYTVINLALNYAVPGTGWTGFFTIKNVTDEQYIADRTRGILPGTPRLFQAGVQYRF